MADKLDPTEEKLSLSMPSLRRKRRKRASTPTETPPAAPAQETPSADGSAAEAPASPPDAPPSTDSEVGSEVGVDPAPVAEPPRDSGAEDTAVLPEAPAAGRDPVGEPGQDERDQSDMHTTDPVGGSAGLASGPIPGAPSPPVSAARPHAEEPAAPEQPVAAEDGEDGSAPWRQRVDLIPMLPGRIAALVTGAVVGLAGTALTYAGLQGCSSVRGTSTCGAPGFILLFAILVILVLLGSVLLNVWQIEGAGSASVLGVGLTTVLVILFLTSVIFSPWMFLVVPVVGAIAFLGAWWVTTHFTDEPVDAWR